MSNRDARPLSEKAMSALHDAALEEIEQGNERWGLPVLLGLHTGFRRTILTHFTDDYITVQDGEKVVGVPKLKECNVEEDGCYFCNKPSTSGPDGYFKPKTENSEQRTVPLFDSWYDYHKGEKRKTHLPKWLDHWFATNDAGWGYNAVRLSKVVKKVAERREDTIAENHQGKEEVEMSNKTQIVPDIILHDLRATWCVQCIKVPNVSEKNIKDWGGWANRQMIDHYAGFVGDHDGTARTGYETGPDTGESGGNSVNGDVDMGEVMEVYSKITNNESLDGKQYSSDVLSAAYEMVQAS